MKEIYVQEHISVPNIKLRKATRRCEDCIKADVCALKSQCEQVVAAAQELSTAHSFTVKIECSHFVEN